MDTRNPKGENVAASAVFKKFLGKAEEYISKPSRLKQLLTDAYQKASDKKDVGSIAHEAWETMQTLFRLIRSSVSGEYTGLPTPTIVAAIAVVIYFLSPIDLIPDFIPVLGLLDDVALVAWFSSTVKDEMDKFAEWEKTHVSLASPASSSASATAAASAAASTKHSAPAGANPVASPNAAETTESAKRAGTTDQPSTDADTHAVLHTDVAASTTDSSRVPNDGAADTGGNVR
ncbi:YkvA family protein [Hymenobacter algoricola]|uniref:DUF1232 domain-containing protein n=1 Tax=Hymenobacter algoricola TaxID=486267 RepID=A0ABP7NL89_9BACT